MVGGGLSQSSGGAALALHYAAKSIPASTEMVVEPMTTMFDAGDELPVPSQAPKR